MEYTGVTTNPGQSVDTSHKAKPGHPDDKSERIEVTDVILPGPATPPAKPSVTRPTYVPPAKAVDGFIKRMEHPKGKSLWKSNKPK